MSGLDRSSKHERNPREPIAALLQILRPRSTAGEGIRPTAVDEKDTSSQHSRRIWTNSTNDLTGSENKTKQCLDDECETTVIPTSTLSLAEFRNADPPIKLYWPLPDVADSERLQVVARSAPKDAFAIMSQAGCKPLDPDASRDTKVFYVPFEKEKRDEVEFLAVKELATFSKDVLQLVQNEYDQLLRIQHNHIIACLDIYRREDEFPGPSGSRVLYRIGILLFPLAKTDLNVMLMDVSEVIEQREEHDAATEHGQFDDLAEKLISYLPCICRAVLYLHSSATLVKHRDIKPHNILIDREDRVVLADFDIAHHYKDVEATITAGKTAFTSSYAPGHVKAGNKDRGLEWDINSLGYVCAEILTVAVGRSRFDMYCFLSGINREHLEQSIRDLSVDHSTAEKEGKTASWLDELASVPQKRIEHDKLVEAINQVKAMMTAKVKAEGVLQKAYNVFRELTAHCSLCDKGPVHVPTAQQDVAAGSGKHMATSHSAAGIQKASAEPTAMEAPDTCPIAPVSNDHGVSPQTQEPPSMPGEIPAEEHSASHSAPLQSICEDLLRKTLGERSGTGLNSELIDYASTTDRSGAMITGSTMLIDNSDGTVNDSIESISSADAVNPSEETAETSPELISSIIFASQPATIPIHNQPVANASRSSMENMEAKEMQRSGRAASTFSSAADYGATAYLQQRTTVQRATPSDHHGSLKKPMRTPSERLTDKRGSIPRRVVISDNVVSISPEQHGPYSPSPPKTQRPLVPHTLSDCNNSPPESRPAEERVFHLIMDNQPPQEVTYNDLSSMCGTTILEYQSSRQRAHIQRIKTSSLQTLTRAIIYQVPDRGNRLRLPDQSLVDVLEHLGPLRRLSLALRRFSRAGVHCHYMYYHCTAAEADELIRGWA